MSPDTTTPDTMSKYDALLVVSFGGPEGPDDVMPFLENVTAGRGVPRARLEAVAEHYNRRGGISPINEQNRRLVETLERELAAAGTDLPVYWGNRNWHPFLEDTIRTMRDDGVVRAIAYVTSAFSSYSGCRQYQENIAAAVAAVGEGAPQIEKLRVFYDHPAFVETLAQNVRHSQAKLSVAADRQRLVFTAHSIPMSMAETSDYVAQLRVAAALVASRSSTPEAGWDLVFQSRSGPPQMPWLEPDIVDHITSLARAGEWGAVVVVPLGFMSDHMEVIQDLDTDAARAAVTAGLEFERVSTVGNDSRIARMIISLVEERSGGERAALGPLDVKPDECPTNCCPAPARRPPTSDGGTESSLT